MNLTPNVNFSICFHKNKKNVICQNLINVNHHFDNCNVKFEISIELLNINELNEYIILSWLWAA